MLLRFFKKLSKKVLTIGGGFGNIVKLSGADGESQLKKFLKKLKKLVDKCLSVWYYE